MRSLSTILLGLLLFAGTAAAQTSPYANALQKAKYQVFTADVNGDGYPDYLLKSTPSVLMLPLDDDDLFPLAYFAGSKTFIISSGMQSSSLAASPAADLINSPLWQPAAYDLAYGDVLGDGLGSMLIKTRTPGGTSFMITLSPSDGSPRLHQTFLISTPRICQPNDLPCLAVNAAIAAAGLGTDLGASGVTVTFERINADNRTDMVVRTNGVVTNVFTSDANGRFYGNTASNKEDTIKTSWNAFLAALTAGDTTTALQYMAPASRSKYQAVFADLGATAQQVPAGLSNFAAIKIESDIAQFVVDQTYQGQTRMSSLIFVYQNNRWLLWEF
jgi:hypothetical protein